MIAPSTARLADLIEQKHDLFLQLRDLGYRQLALIEEGDMTRLLRVLAGKQRLLAALQDVERALDPFRDEDPDRRTWQSPEERAQCARRASECESLLAAVLEQERYSEARMIACREEAALRLRAMEDWGQAGGAYRGDAVDCVSGELDLTSEG